ncbi:MAG: OmpH family outer membrane protein [Alphaproteobacteria bacterium]|nr:OmpH family outer membrane protein [Alphaproteobacteria bacterium]
MMHRLVRLAVAPLLAGLLLSAVAGGALHAQTNEPAKPAPMAAPVIAVIDFQRVVKESSAGKSIRQFVNSRQAEFQAQIKKIQQELEVARQELANGPSGVSREEFEKKRKEMRERVAQLQGIVQNRKRELDEMFNTGMRQVDIALVAVLKELAEERGINLILNAGRGRGLVLFAQSGIIITDEALRRLNARLPKVDLTDPAKDK